MMDYDYPSSYWVELFSQMYDLGVHSHHVSNEYKSFQFYCDVLSEFYSQYPEKKISHIVKLAEPHFGNNSFNSSLLKEKVHIYRKELFCHNDLFGIQWMWRGNLTDDKARCEAFFEKSRCIKDTITELKTNKLIKNFLVFPYTLEFAEVVLRLDSSHKNFFDGFVVYRNKMETEYDSILNKALKYNLVLRPLNAGKTLENFSSKDSVNFSLSHKNVKGCIISISTIARLNEII